MGSTASWSSSENLNVTVLLDEMAYVIPFIQGESRAIYNLRDQEEVLLRVKFHGGLSF